MSDVVSNSGFMLLSSAKIAKRIDQQRYTIYDSHCSVLSYLLMTLLNLSLALDCKIILFLCI